MYSIHSYHVGVHLNQHTIPEGFKRCRGDGTFNDVLSPLYMKLVEGNPVIGMWVEKQHCNFAGIAHGGCLMTLMDMALAGAVCAAIGHYTTTPTVSASYDFMAAAQQGDWIYADITSVNLTRTMGFANAMVCGPRGHVARASGCFKLPADLSKHPGMPAADYHAWRMSGDQA